jgi:hypothetical protein
MAPNFLEKSVIGHHYPLVGVEAQGGIAEQFINHVELHIWDDVGVETL